MTNKGKIVLTAVGLLLSCAVGAKTLSKTEGTELLLSEKDIVEGTSADALKEEDASREDLTKALPAAEEPEILLVHVCGAVQKPGVYPMEAGSRVYEAVAAAGGFTADAARDYLNLAGALLDGTKLYVPAQDEIEAGELSSEAGAKEGFGAFDAASDGKVNLNTATEAELKALPGIGDAKARAIVAYRETKGGFFSIEEIMQVEGIKEGMFTKIRDQITVK